MIRDPDFAQASPQWVGDIVARWSRARGAEVALASEGRSHTWRELEQERVSWSARLLALGVRPGDRVMVVGENCPAMVMLVFAIATLRAWVVNVNAR